MRSRIAVVIGSLFLLGGPAGAATIVPSEYSYNGSIQIVDGDLVSTFSASTEDEPSGSVRAGGTLVLHLDEPETLMIQGTLSLWWTGEPSGSQPYGGIGWYLMSPLATLGYLEFNPWEYPLPATFSINETFLFPSGDSVLGFWGRITGDEGDTEVGYISGSLFIDGEKPIQQIIPEPDALALMVIGFATVSVFSGRSRSQRSHTKAS